MASPSYTYTLTNGSTADATQVQQNFSDILNGVSDGTKDLSINALTCAGTATLNGNVNLGNASADDITVTGSIASSIPIKTNNSFDIGASTLKLRRTYSQFYYGIQDSTASGTGDLGEVQTISRIRSNGVTLSTGAPKFVCTTTNIVLQPGKYGCRAMVGFTPGATTTVSEIDAYVSTSSTEINVPGADVIAVPTSGEIFLTRGFPTSFVMTNDTTIEIPWFEITVATSTTKTIYLKASATFATSTMKAYGWMQVTRTP